MTNWKYGPKSSASEIAPPNLTADPSILGLQPGQQLTAASNNLICLEPRGLKTRFGFLQKIIIGDKLECARKVSMKTEIKKRPTKEKHHAGMLRTEYQAFQRLGSHPNIIKFKGAYEDSNSVHFITSPYCSGGTLLDWLNADTGIPVSEGQLATYFKQVVEAVSWCHGKGVIHGDLKFENILFTDTSVQAVVKLIDFDNSTLMDLNDPSKLYKHEHGSILCMAPEIHSEEGYHTSADMWSVGVLLYWCLCGTPPFTAEPSLAFWPKLSSLSEKEAKAVDLANQKIADEIYKAMSKHVQEYNQCSFKPEEDWAHVSGSAKDCVQKLLTKSREGRMTAAQFLEHEWVTAKGSASHCALPPPVIERLRKVSPIELVHSRQRP